MRKRVLPGSGERRLEGCRRAVIEIVVDRFAVTKCGSRITVTGFADENRPVELRGYNLKSRVERPKHAQAAGLLLAGNDRSGRNVLQT